MAEIKSLLEPLVLTPASRQAERRKRKDQFDRTTVSAASIKEHEEDGWTIDRELKTKTRLKRPKSVDEILENRVWLLLDQLGFSELNQGRSFKIQFMRSKKVNGEKQIDIFAKDDETIVIVECKSAHKIYKKSLQKDIEELANLQKKIATSIRNHYGSEFNPKIVWIMATSNIIWTEPDKKRAEGENINIVTERELRYFLELSKHLGSAGKYQFLAHFLEGQKIPALKNNQVPAIRGKLGGNTFYAFVTTASQLLKVAFVNHRTLNDPHSAPSYQRLIERKRLKQIQSFIVAGGFFPTNIIVNFSKKRRFDIQQKDNSADIHFGQLYLPDTFKSAWVIDGQHRLYSFADLDSENSDQNIFVIAFEQMERTEEANLFVTINHEQKTVPKTLLDDLKGELHWGSIDPKQRIIAMCSRLVNLLNEDTGEPFHQKIVQTGLKGTKEACLTLPQLVEGLSRSSLLGSSHRKLKTYENGPFTGTDDYLTLDRARHTLNNYFGAIKNANPLIWDKGSEGGVCFNISIRGLFLILEECLKIYEIHTSNDPVELTAEELAQVALDYSSPLLEFLEQKTDSDIYRLFREGVPHGSSGPKELYLKLVNIMRTKTHDFGPANFNEWKEAQDEERANIAAEKIQNLNAKICEVLFGILKKKYGAEEYFEKSVKNKQRAGEAYTNSLDDSVEQRGALEEYLNLIDYKKIAEKTDHWSILKPIFDIPLKGEKGAAKNIKWMERLNDIRKRTSHKSNGRPLSVEDIEFVEWIFDVFEEKVSTYQENNENLSANL